MTVITHARRKSRLAKLIDSAGGVSVGVALDQARANIAGLRERGLQEVGRRIEELAAIPLPGAPGPAEGVLQQVYRAAGDIVDAAAPFGLEEICAVAISLCDVVDRMSDSPSPDWRVVEVHAGSLRLLNALPPEAEAERGQIIDQLAEMVARKFPQTG